MESRGSSLGSRLETGALFCSRIFHRLGLQNLLPRRYQNVPIEFDMKAVQHCGAESFYPLLSEANEIAQFNETFGGLETMAKLYEKSVGATQKLIGRS